MKKDRRLTGYSIFATCRFQCCLLFYIFTSFFAENTYAQVFELNNMPPPKLEVTFSKGNLRESGFAVLKVTIPPSWHVNSNIPVDDFLKPSSAKISATGIYFDSLEWPTPKKDYNEILELENLIFEETFFIKAPIKNTDEFYDSTQVNASFHYQACSKSICLAPDSVSTTEVSLFSYPFTTKTKKTNSQQQKKSLPKKDSGVIKEVSNDSIPTPTATSQIQESKQEIKTTLPKDSNKNSDFPFILLLFAFLGGILLNLMPCVLPVLSLKLFSLIRQASESRKRLTLLSFTSCIGILVSFWILALIIVIARMFGNNPGWGMQFQSASFLACMVALLTLFAMSFFGIFEIWLPGKTITTMDNATRKNGFVGAFFTGMLLVLLSTPCSAPFLGSAMGFAFNAPNSMLFLFFTAAGLGLGLPYILIGLFPTSLRFIPKPGPWMTLLQKAMGFLLLLSVIWLLWVGSSAFGKEGLFLFFGIALLNGLFSFIVGKFAPPYKPFLREVIIFAIVILINAVIILFGTNLLQKKMSNVVDDWIPYSSEELTKLRLKGHSVFMDVTAEWCLTCKANEMAVLSSQDVESLFAQKNVKKMKADWTHSSPEVSKLLFTLKRSGVPAYAMYSPDTNEKPLVLPEILTLEQIRKAIESTQKANK